ncbi:MAG: T9SS type A sorting domain-containing protein [Bacteroidia bacterium]|nr:T9SS type A sorting domain-containing protein [Bacteroidia bacterium]
MKLKLLSFVTALSLLNTPDSQAQYQSLYCAYPASYELGSAFVTNNAPGTLCFGYNAQVNPNGTWNDNKNFCIMGSGSSNIMVTYKAYFSDSCTNNVNQILSQTGLSAVETNGPLGLTYAVVGAHDRGLYFVGLNANGVILNKKSYPFLLEKSLYFERPSKPLIIQGETNNVFYVCGSYDSDMFVLKIDANGNIVWSNFYTLLNNTVPKDMILDPFHPGTLIVIGTTNVEKKDNEGFFMSLSNSTGAVVNCNTYGRVVGYDSFNTITISHNQVTGNADGYTIGGYQHALLPLTPSAWVIKLDANLNVKWSNGVFTSLGLNKGYVDIEERLNSMGHYEYYGLLESTAGMHVTKLDHQGTPYGGNLSQNFFSNLTMPNNEFIYDVPALVPSKATCLSLVNNYVNGGSDIGLQIFGNSYYSSGFVGTYQVNSYFNGETNCYRTLLRLPGSKELLYTAKPLQVSMHDNLTQCSNFQVVAFNVNSPLTLLCAGTSVSGSNMKPMGSGEAVNGETGEMTGDVQIFPNPTSNKAFVTYSIPENGQCKLEVFNMLGALIYSNESTNRENERITEEIDLEKLNVQEGIYTVALTVNNTVTKQKLIYTK